ncbi:MAG: hypothetical protein ACK519_07220, partial [Sphingomonadaceae bacterium]
QALAQHQFGPSEYSIQITDFVIFILRHAPNGCNIYTVLKIRAKFQMVDAKGTFAIRNSAPRNPEPRPSSS